MNLSRSNRTFLGLGIIAASLGAAMLLTYQNLRINLSPSMPYGLWWISENKEPKRGDFVTLCLPGEAGALAFERGYIGQGGCPDSHEALLKPVAAVGGDVVRVTADGVTVNGVALANSAPFRSDTEGRAMSSIPPGQYVVDVGMIWVIAGHDPRSYDSRYFGPIATATITGTARALLTQ
jgi:conjugative transfer signal peptidase TraF